MQTETILRQFIVQKIAIPGNAVSIMIKSFVNLVEIDPDGLESKNKINDLATLYVKASCMFFVAPRNYN